MGWEEPGNKKRFHVTALNKGDGQGRLKEQRRISLSNFYGIVTVRRNNFPGGMTRRSGSQGYLGDLPRVIGGPSAKLPLSAEMRNEGIKPGLPKATNTYVRLSKNGCIL
jgi:hypothetical protein